jgi:uncharacterized protein
MQITVVTIESLARYNATSIEAFATRLFNAWGIGDATRNDGILILVAVADRTVRIELGVGYPPVHDGRALRVIDALMLPEFRDGRLAAGIEAGVTGAVEHIARPFRAGNPVTETSGIPAPPSTFPWDFAAFIAFVLALIGWKARGAVADMMVARRPCPRCGNRHVEGSRRVTEEATAKSGGAGIWHRACPSCDWSEDRPYRIAPTRSSGSGGGGGSFGGGRSGGGGATGRW